MDLNGKEEEMRNCKQNKSILVKKKLQKAFKGKKKNCKQELHILDEINDSDSNELMKTHYCRSTSNRSDES